MKIDERKGVLDPLVGVLPGHGVGATALSGARDRVSVSETARELVHLRAELGGVELLRMEKVTGLRAVMAKGSYSSDVRDVSRKLLRELLGQLVV